MNPCQTTWLAIQNVAIAANASTSLALVNEDFVANYDNQLLH